MSDQIEEAQQTRHNRRLENEQHPIGGPPTTKMIMSVQPKDNVENPTSNNTKSFFIFITK